jgi:outer membrane protein assembly factor BamB
MSTKTKFLIPWSAVIIATLIISLFVAEGLLNDQAEPKVTKANEAIADTGTTELEPEPVAEPELEPELELEPVPEPHPEPKPPVGPIVTPVATTWSTYHGGPELAGYSDAEIPSTLEVLWRFQADGSVYHTPVANEQGIYVGTLKGEVYGLDFAGNERWHTRLIREVRDDGRERMERTEAPIACFMGTVFVATLTGKVYGLDAESGDVKWIYEVDGPILGTVNLLETESGSPPRLFVIGQADGALHSIDPATGKRVWKAKAIDQCDGSASAGNGSIVFGSCAAAFHIFSADNGKVTENIELDPDSQVAGGVAIAGDSVFGGSHSGRVFHASMSLGEILWINEDSEDEVFTTPSLSEDSVVFASYDGNVYALDRLTGSLKWKYETDGFPTSTVIARDRVYVGIDGVLYVMNLSDGEVLWSYEVSDEIASPAIIHNSIVVGSEDGTVTAFGAKPKTE